MITTSATTNERRKRHVIFDFDWTMIDANTDLFIYEQLNPDLLRQITERASEIQWTELMQSSIESLLQTRRITEVEQCLVKCPFAPEMISILRQLNNSATISTTATAEPLSLGENDNSGDDWGENEVSIVSDANRFFIDTILRHHGAHDLVHGVYTNAAMVHTESNSVRLTQFCTHIQLPHQCSTCPVNMCKGEIVQRLRHGHYHLLNSRACTPSDLSGTVVVMVDNVTDGSQTFTSQNKENGEEQETPSPQVIYVGDGSNDFCAAKQLTIGDYLFVRRGFRLEKLIAEGGHEQLQCQIEYWTDWKDLLQLFQTHR